MKLEIELNEQEARLIQTFIRRAVYEQYYENMAEAGDSAEKAENRAYSTISAFNKIRSAIEKAL